MNVKKKKVITVKGIKGVKNTKPHFTPGQRVRIIRGLAEMTRKEFSAHVGVSIYQLQAVERDKQTAGIDFLAAIGTQYPKHIPWLVMESYEFKMSEEEMKKIREDVSKLPRPKRGRPPKKVDS